jgi:hypothetical protein
MLCAISGTQIAGPSFINRLLIQSGLSVAFLGPMLTVKKGHMVILCKMVLQHTIIPFMF